MGGQVERGEGGEGGEGGGWPGGGEASHLLLTRAGVSRCQ